VHKRTLLRVLWAYFQGDTSGLLNTLKDSAEGVHCTKLLNTLEGSYVRSALRGEVPGGHKNLGKFKAQERHHKYA
jgi:hypothetical protein